MADKQPEDEVLPDGTTIHTRSIREDDKERMLAMWARTSPESRRRRFMGSFDLNWDNVGRFTDVDPDQEVAFVATRGRAGSERIAGVARYVRYEDDPRHAEFAALVEDAEQGKGIGTALVRRIAVAAHEDGITRLAGDILADNTRMLNVVRELGLEYQSRREGGTVVHSDLETSLTEHFLDVVHTRERHAAKAALNRFFRPERVAVVGASRDRTSIGGLVFNHLIAGGFAGVVYPVNPNTPYVQGVASYSSLRECPQVPDMVMICVPASFVNDVVDQAGELGVKAVCIISAGFSEAGEVGRERQDDLMERARGHGLRIVGPNCMGLLNGSPQVRMNGTFSTVFPDTGRVSMSSQSGALGLAVLDHVQSLGLGISTFVSVGNKADISGNDLLLYWEEDPDTDVILLYLESFGNPRKFSRIARRISRSKPIVVVKSGRSTAGVRAASSHTAAISAGDTAVDALFSQTGVIRTTTMKEMFDVATLLSSQPLPRGRKVGILTNAGGPGILAADACEANNLEVPTLSDRTREQLASFLPSEAGISNPVDMIASASGQGYARGLEILGSAPEIDILFVIFIPTGAAETDEIADALVRASMMIPDHVPIVSVFMSAEGMPPELAEAKIPSFPFPEATARALGRVVAHARWKRTPLGDVIEPTGLDRDRARGIVEAALTTPTDETGRPVFGRPHAAMSSDMASAGHGSTAAESAPPAGEGSTFTAADEGRWLTSAEATGVLEAYGVPLARSRLVTTPAQGAEAQRELGARVAVKSAAPIHKTDVGGIELDLETPEEVADAIERIATAMTADGVGEHADAFLVQEMVDEGTEMVVGVTHDPSFGPIVMTGMGGTMVELQRDVAVRITPLTDRDVSEMLASLRMAPVLAGYRGAPPADVTALKDLLHRINAMVEDLPEVTELDLNPVFVKPEGGGVVAVDMRMRVVPMA